jgi:alkaline phosphatase
VRGATAFSTGYKTKNGYMGLDSLGNIKETILETAAKNGVSTGIVVTCEVVHATPAAFMVHYKSRYDYENIAVEILKCPINVLIGGGRKYFENRTDFVNLSEKLRQKQTDVIYTLEDTKSSKANNVICLAASEALPKISEGRGDFLLEGVKIALDRLSKNNKGFFLMVEGSQIDLGGHAKSTDYVVSEMIDFDKAVGEAFRFADLNPGTLVIVTADHETGGMVLTGGNIALGTVGAEFITTQHTAVMVPVFAYGEDAGNFTGFYENTAIYTKIVKEFAFNVAANE